jgi:hypothetical protein
MEQVPRYFEEQPWTTITSKDENNVLMRKASSSHKRFTATFTISMEGHLLFSKLKKNPKVHKEVLVAVNETGMWSTDFLEKNVEEILLKQPQTSLLIEPVLEKRNIFIELIPPNMTTIMQPLDVAVKKRFQEAFDSSYDSYISEAIENPDMQTKQVNP